MERFFFTTDNCVNIITVPVRVYLTYKRVYGVSGFSKQWLLSPLRIIMILFYLFLVAILEKKMKTSHTSAREKLSQEIKP